MKKLNQKQFEYLLTLQERCSSDGELLEDRVAIFIGKVDKLKGKGYDISCFAPYVREYQAVLREK